ncbi:MAG: hypothetical protein AB7U98_10305 [Candidatus Nitrosocosmicus sp.]
MEYQDIGKKIMDTDGAIRFVRIINTDDGTKLYSEHKTGITNLLSPEESEESHQMAVNAWKTRSKLYSKIGKGKYVLADYEKIKRITMPLDESHLLYITTEADCDALGLIDKIRGLNSGN